MDARVVFNGLMVDLTRPQKQAYAVRKAAFVEGDWRLAKVVTDVEHPIQNADGGQAGKTNTEPMRDTTSHQWPTRRDSGTPGGETRNARPCTKIRLAASAPIDGSHSSPTPPKRSSKAAASSARTLNNGSQDPFDLSV